MTSSVSAASASTPTNDALYPCKDEKIVAGHRPCARTRVAENRRCHLVSLTKPLSWFSRQGRSCDHFDQLVPVHGVWTYLNTPRDRHYRASNKQSALRVTVAAAFLSLGSLRDMGGERPYSLASSNLEGLGGPSPPAGAVLTDERVQSRS